MNKNVGTSITPISLRNSMQLSFSSPFILAKTTMSDIDRDNLTTVGYTCQSNKQCHTNLHTSKYRSSSIWPLMLEIDVQIWHKFLVAVLLGLVWFSTKLWIGMVLVQLILSLTNILMVPASTQRVLIFNTNHPDISFGTMTSGADLGRSSTTSWF